MGESKGGMGGKDGAEDREKEKGKMRGSFMCIMHMGSTGRQVSARGPTLAKDGPDCSRSPTDMY